LRTLWVWLRTQLKDPSLRLQHGFSSFGLQCVTSLARSPDQVHVAQATYTILVMGHYPKLPLTAALNKHHQVPGALEGARGLKSSTRRKAQVVNADWCKTLSISMSEEKNKKPVLGLGLLMRQGLSLQMRVVTACRRTLVQGSAPGRGECHVRPLIPNMPVP
jgi:hypothetical protein